MKQQHHDYKVVLYPKMRRRLAITFRPVQRKPMMHGLIEVDVTRARAHLREHKANTGEALSFTAFIIACLGKAVDEYKAVQASRKGRNHLILFDEADVLTYIERDMSGQMPSIPCIVRAANRKTFREIHHENRAAQVETVAKAVEGFKAFQFLPTLLFRFLLWMLGRYPQMGKKYRGTVGLTAVGMLGKGTGWGIPPATPTLKVRVQRVQCAREQRNIPYVAYTATPGFSWHHHAVLPVKQNPGLWPQLANRIAYQGNNSTATTHTERQHR